MYSVAGKIIGLLDSLYGHSVFLGYLRQVFTATDGMCYGLGLGSGGRLGRLLLGFRGGSCHRFDLGGLFLGGFHRFSALRKSGSYGRSLSYRHGGYSIDRCRNSTTVVRRLRRLSYRRFGFGSLNGAEQFLF